MTAANEDISKELKELSKKIAEVADNLNNAPLQKIITLGSQLVALGKKVSDQGNKVKEMFG